MIATTILIRWWWLFFTDKELKHDTKGCVYHFMGYITISDSLHCFKKKLVNVSRET